MLKVLPPSNLYCVSMGLKWKLEEKLITAANQMN
jgi:hypothetical protein